jgi:RimJ/RimL family protein N-acetyltransferase
MASTPHWPLLALSVRTPRIELRPPDESTVLALIDLASQGIHDADSMPFLRPWTRLPSPQRERESFQFYARCWAEWTVDRWQLPFAVWVDGEPVGVQAILGEDFPRRRTFSSGSWLGRDHQGQGIGKEMRAAMLHFGFDGLGARRAVTGAFHDNTRSLGVTAALGYEPNGDALEWREDHLDRCLDFKLDRDDWQRSRRDDIVIEGLDACRDLFVPAA